MSKKIGKKIWIYVGVGVFLVIVGIISWGVATDWKFIGGKKSGSGGPSPPSPPSPPCPPSEDPCDPTKCKQCSSDKKKCMLCYDGYTLNDGICVCQDENKKLNNCCPKGSTRDNTGSCCPNNRLTTTGDCCNSPVCPFGNIKVCCDGVDQQCDNDGKKRGCYISCGSEKCYNGGKCVDDGKGKKYCENKDCKWESIPSTNPSYISDISKNNFPECETNPKCTPNSDGTYTLNTTGITTTDNGEPISDSQGNPYTFIYKPSYGKNLLPKKYKMVSEIKAPKQDPDYEKKCNKDDCNNILNIFGNGTITNDMPATCKMRYDGANVMDFPEDAKCPFENDTKKGRGNPALRCCPGLFVDTFGQICPEGNVGAMKKEEGGLIFECVSVEQCVGDNGKICGGNGNCEYDSTLNKGFCKCDDKYGVIYGNYCQPISQFKFTNGTTYTFNFYPTGVYVSCYDITKDISAMDLMTKFLSDVDTDLELVNDGMIYYIETNDKSYRADNADSSSSSFTNIINSDCVYNGKCISTSSGGVAWTNQLVGGCSDNSKSNCNQCPFTVSTGGGTWNSDNRWDGEYENYYKASWVVVHKKNTNKYALINIYRWFINADYYIANQKMSIDNTATTFAKGDAYQYHFLDNTNHTQFTYDKTKIYFTPTSAEEEYNDYLSDPGCFRDTTGDFKKKDDQENTCDFVINTDNSEILNQKHNWFVNQVDETCNDETTYCDPLSRNDYQSKWRALGPTLKKKAEEAKKKAEEAKNDRNKKLKEEICKTTQKK